MRHSLPAAILTAATTLILVLATSGCESSDASQKEDAAKAAEAAIPVEIALPARKELLATYSGTATLEAEGDAEVISKVQGEVQKLLVEEGDRVSAGQLLATLDGRQLRLEATQAAAELAKLERDYKRQVELNQKGLVAAGTFESLRYDLESLRARHELAVLQLSYTEIRAPFAGIVATRNIKLGQTVQPNTALFRVTDPSPLKAHVFVPERELKRLKPGQAAAVQVDAVPGKAFHAKVTLVSPTIDTRTATFKTTIEIDDASGELRPGMFARVGIVFERKQKALQIPRVALVETDGERSVFIVQDGVARQKNVGTGLTDAGNVEILEGLNGDEQIVIVGQSGLKDGNKVRVVTLQAKANT
jgi:membrane fusion protein (multidrug efflux system)